MASGAGTATSGRRILVVDDEPALVDVVAYNLEQAGFDVSSAFDGRAALAMVEESPPDLVILDIMLPGLDGLTVCRAIREKHPLLPVVMLTARSDEMYRVLGLETGADDYVTKPFSPRELVARVRAVLRRSPADARTDTSGRAASGTTGDGDPGNRGEVLALTPSLSLDRRGRELLRDGTPVDLTPTEYRLLEALAAHPGQALSRAQLLDLGWGEEAFGDERTVDVHIRHLREKMEEDPSRPRLILTLRGFGYKLRPVRGPEARP